MVLCVFCGLAAWGLTTRQEKESEAAERAPRRVDYRPIRGEVKPMRLRLGDRAYACNECHRTPTTPERYPRLIPEHASWIYLQHGDNNDCLNCHNRENRMLFVDYSGGEIPAESPQLLCKKCHGPRYRDWEEGVHGRRGGHWDDSLGEQRSLRCVQCHDPHAPQFQPLKPMPAPRIDY